MEKKMIDERLKGMKKLIYAKDDKDPGRPLTDSLKEKLKGNSVAKV